MALAQQNKMSSITPPRLFKQIPVNLRRFNTTGITSSISK
jgi:hypothetical protein